jgi:hypothetical protein
MWLLLESEQTYFFVCDEARIDAVRLRGHLRECFGQPVDGWNVVEGMIWVADSCI